MHEGLDFIAPQTLRVENTITYVSGFYIHRIRLTKEQFKGIPEKYQKELDLFARRLSLFRPDASMAYDVENGIAEIKISGYVKTQNEEVKRFVDSLVKRISKRLKIPYIEPKEYKEQYVLDDLKLKRSDVEHLLRPTMNTFVVKFKTHEDEIAGFEEIAKLGAVFQREDGATFINGEQLDKLDELGVSYEFFTAKPRRQ